MSETKEICMDEMRAKCCVHEYKSIAEDPDSIETVYAILMEGCTGWGNMSEEKVRSYFEDNELDDEEDDIPF